jgi:hypothetical protein
MKLTFGLAPARLGRHAIRGIAMACTMAVGCSGNHSGEEELKTQFPELAAAVNDSDRAGASTELGRTDRDGDGNVTEAEWAASRYQPADRFKLNDLNGDGVLTPYEHSLRWAQYRLGREQAARKAKR